MSRFYPLRWYYFLGDNMKPLKEKVSLTLDGPVMEKIRELAEYEDRSVSSYINLVLREHLEQKKEKETR